MRLLLPLFLLAISQITYSLPIWTTRVTYDNTIFFRDHQDEHLVYYFQQAFKFTEKNDGSPDCILLRLAAADGTDNGKSQHLLQFSLRRSQTPSEALRWYQQQYGQQQWNFRPLPVRKIVPAVIIGTQQNVVGEITTNWEQRTFTIPLTPTQATLLEQQIQKNNLSVSIGLQSFGVFAVTASTLATNLIDSLQKAKFSKLLPSVQPILLSFQQTILHLPFVNLSTVILNDTNRQLYLPLNIICHDFDQQISPDLLLKKVEVCGKGLQQKRICQTYTFKSDRPTRQISQFNQPVQSAIDYRIISIYKNGKTQYSSWQAVTTGTLIDVSTVAPQTKQRTLTIESALTPTSDRWVAVELSLNYHYADEVKKEVLLFTAADVSPVQHSSFYYDQRYSITFSLKWKAAGGETKISDTQPVTGDYLLLIPPRN